MLRRQIQYYGTVQILPVSLPIASEKQHELLSRECLWKLAKLACLAFASCINYSFYVTSEANQQFVSQKST